MRQLTRPRVAQILLLAVVGAMLLPWADGGGASVAGFDVDEGRIAAFAAAVGIGLIHIGWRPAWIVSGFAAAILAKEIVDVNDQAFVSPGVGLWLGTLLAVAATVALVWEMFANLDRSGAT